MKKAIILIVTFVIVMVFSGATSATDGSWQTQTVATGDYYMDSSLALDSADNPHISYNNFLTDDLMYASKIGGSWIIETVVYGNIDDQGSRLALDSSNNPHIIYRDRTFNHLWYASKTGFAWIVEDVDGKFTNVGVIAIDSNNKPHIIYSYSISGDLGYASRIDGSWVIEKGFNIARNPHPFSIAFDSSNNPHILYEGFIDQTFALLYAVFVPNQASFSDSKSLPDGVNAEAASKAVAMQKTGIPIGVLVLALLTVFTGFLIPRRK